MSFFQERLDREKTNLKKDYEVLEAELSILQSEIIDENSKKYLSGLKSEIYSNNMVAIRGSLELIQDELKLLDKAFTEAIIEDLDYFMNTYSKSPYSDVFAGRIIRAKLDIERFNKSKISIKDFNRDFQTVKINIKDIRRFLTLSPPYINLQKPSEILKELHFDINIQDAKRFGCDELVKEIRFSDQELKYLMDILTNGSRQRLPRLEDNYIEKRIELFYGKKEE